MTSKATTAPHKRTAKTAKAVANMVADNFTNEQIKRYTGLSINTLRKYYGDELAATKRKPGKPAHVPTHRKRLLVKFMKINGASNERIAEALEIDRSTLERHYREETHLGTEQLNAEITAGLAANALAGDKISQIVWLKMFAGRYEAKAPVDTGNGAADMADIMAKLAEGLPGA